ncbi:hypothetical protein KW459_16065 [Vibrio fluvialis]|nr:hypothetical protein [Vibrio fluvialis]
MTDIFIDLDKPVFAANADLSLLQMIKEGKFRWPNGATCATQDCDGAITWWDAPIEEVCAARVSATPEDGLMPLIGLANSVNEDYYEVDERAYTANDWLTAVVSHDEFLAASD